MAIDKPSFKIADCPDNKTVHGWMDSVLNLSEKFNGLIPETTGDPFIKFKINNFDIPQILNAVSATTEKYGWHGFLSHFKDTTNITKQRTKYYGGFSITHNPDIAYPVDEHASALGEPKANLGTFFKSGLGIKIWMKMEEMKITHTFYKICFEEGMQGVKTFLLHHGLISIDDSFEWADKLNSHVSSSRKGLKNGYFDTYSFRNLSTGAQTGMLGNFLTNRMQRSLCRSRAAFIDGTAWSTISKELMWHYDEPIYLNLRINIPLQTSNNYVCEIKGDSNEYHFDVGYAYCWDTTVVHRVYAKLPEDSKRIHLVLGTIPWFDFDHDSQTYYANEFYGEMHPFDMVANGHIISDISVT